MTTPYGEAQGRAEADIKAQRALHLAVVAAIVDLERSNPEAARGFLESLCFHINNLSWIRPAADETSRLRTEILHTRLMQWVQELRDVHARMSPEEASQGDLVRRSRDDLFQILDP